MDTPRIRDSEPRDLPAIEALYPAVFPDEDLLPVVRALLGGEPGVLSLVAEAGASLAGHVIFTPCRAGGGADGEGDASDGDASDGDASDGAAALLAPLAVAPARQRQGIGSALVREGLRRLGTGGVRHVFVLGDPAYYGRFGFAREDRVAPPYPLPQEWRGGWQSLGLGGCGPARPGVLALPEPWLRPGLWAP